LGFKKSKTIYIHSFSQSTLFISRGRVAHQINMQGMG
jgi:hypothetical protein